MICYEWLLRKLRVLRNPKNISKNKKELENLCNGLKNKRKEE